MPGSEIAQSIVRNKSKRGQVNGTRNPQTRHIAGHIHPAFHLLGEEVGILTKCDFHDDFKDDFKETIQDHESRIRELEIKSAKVLEKMDAVCKDLQSVTAWIKTLIGFGLTSMVGFFIWYIQSLPR